MTALHDRPLRPRLSGLGLCLAVLGGTTAVAVLPSAAFAASTTPGAPTIRSVKPGDGKLVVSLKAPSSNGGSSILGYVVTATAGSQTVNQNTSSSTATLTGLTDGVTYQVTAKALNANGLGPASAAVAGTPVAGPLSLTVTSDSPTFVRQDTRVTYSGQVTRSGAGVPAQAVTVTETYLDGRQVGLGQTLTDGTGHYSFSFVPLYNGQVDVSVLSANASVPSRALVDLSTPRVIAQHGRSITVTAASSPGFVTSPDRVERAQLLVVDTHGTVVRDLGTVAAAQRVSRHGYAHGVNDITVRAVLPGTGTYRIVVKVLGTPVNTGATSTAISIRG